MEIESLFKNLLQINYFLTTFVIVKEKNLVKLEGIRVYSDTLAEVKKYVSRLSPRMTIIRFFDEAAKEKLNNIKNSEKNGF